MTVNLHKLNAKAEANDALARHLNVLSQVEKICFVQNVSKEGFLYLSATPIIYSAWEGFFRLSCAICLRRMCNQGMKAGRYDKAYAALWLQKEKFLDDFLSKLFNTMTLGREANKPGAGKFRALIDFSNDLKGWFNTPLNHAMNFDKLVMTYSNVNSDVAKLNAGIIGLDTSGIDFSRLNELLNRRNEISHGGLITYPHEAEISALLVYTENLMKDFNTSILNWLRDN